MSNPVSLSTASTTPGPGPVTSSPPMKKLPKSDEKTQKVKKESENSSINQSKEDLSNHSFVDETHNAEFDFGSLFTQYAEGAADKIKESQAEKKGTQIEGKGTQLKKEAVESEDTHIDLEQLRKLDKGALLEILKYKEVFKEHVQIVNIVDGKIALSAGKNADINELNQAMNENKIAIVLPNRTLFIHPDVLSNSGLQLRDGRATIIDDHGNEETVNCHTFTHDELHILTISFQDYVNAKTDITPIIDDNEKKNKKDDHKSIEHARIAVSLGPNGLSKQIASETASDVPNPDGKVSKEQKETRNQAEADRLKNAKQLDDKATETTERAVKKEIRHKQG